jgi:protein TonB
MRKYTLVFSICAHAVAVGALIIAPALATDDLPEPRRSSAFIIVKPEAPLPVPTARRQSSETPSIQTTVPLIPPETLPPEAVVEAVDPAGVDGGALVTGIALGEVASNSDLVAPPPAPPRPKEPVRVGGWIKAPTKLVSVDPIYPPLAIAARKEGLVILEALISEEGIVREVRVLRREPLFEQAAIAAVQQWRFSPTLLNGEPVPVVMTVTIRFSLTK